MKDSKIVLISVCAFILSIILILFIMNFNYKNEQAKLVNQYNMQLSKIEGVYDKYVEDT